MEGVEAGVEVGVGGRAVVDDHLLELLLHFRLQTLIEHRQFLRSFIDDPLQVLLACFQTVDASAIGPEASQAEPERHDHPEPEGLIEKRTQVKRERRAGLVPHAVAVAGDHVEGVEAGVEVGVGGRAVGDRFAPGVFIALQLILVHDAVGVDEAQRCKMKFDLVHARRQFGMIEIRKMFFIDDDVFDQNRRRHLVGAQLGRVDHRHAFDRRKPEPAGVIFPPGGLKAAVHLVAFQAVALAIDHGGECVEVAHGHGVKVGFCANAPAGPNWPRVKPRNR